jgi:2-polyprenyl-3-methyl-5-hydroxy-6-metoxy-1,4-benzoquinol methylase
MPSHPMTAPDRHAHWQNVYLNKGEEEISWHQISPHPSLGLIEKYASGHDTPIIDIGAGASRLVDALRRDGFTAVTLLDISEAALQKTKDRLGADAGQVKWIAADVTKWQCDRPFDIWHDRAAFHFLVERTDREAYVERLRAGVRPGGHAIIATFALDGPEKCSGLPVQRYSSTDLSDVLGPTFDLVERQLHRHVTPWGAVQSFQFSVLCRR